MTPRQRKQTIIPPEGGWKPNTVYHVEVAFGKSNPIHGYLFFSGFLGADKTPQGYNEFYGCEDNTNISDVYYMRVLSVVITEKDIHCTPNRGKMVYNIPNL